MFIYTKLLVSVFIFSSLVTSCNPDGHSSDKVSQSVGSVFPPIDYHEVIDSNGELTDLTDFKDKIVLLNFWATWCGPCRYEIPDLVKLRSEYDRDKLAIIGVSLDQGSNEKVLNLLEKFIRRYEINYPVLLDVNGEMVRKIVGGQMQSLAVPMTFIFDRQGKMRAKHVGVPRGKNGLDPYGILKEEIESLL
jgi:thiol-disulfide isomerase/thioredoxin